MVASIYEINMQIILLVVMAILKYTFSALSFFSFMHKRKMPHKFIAFLPIINTTIALGNLSDSINKNYRKKTFNRFWVLISYMLSIISGFLSLVLLRCYLPDFYEKFLNSILSQNYNLNVPHPDVSLIPPLVRFVILACILVLVISIIANLILNFSCFFSIYKEYSKDRFIMYILLAIVGECFLGLKFIPSLLVFLMRRNVPAFELLNELKTSDIQLPT